MQVPLGAIAVVQGHVRLGKVGTTQNARQRGYNQDFELELDNEKKNNFITRQRREQLKDKLGPKLWLRSNDTNFENESQHKNSYNGHKA